MKIAGTGSALPKKIVSNDELSKFLDTSDEWIYTRTCVLFGDGAGAAVLTPGDNIKDVALTAKCDVDKLWQYDVLHPTPFITKEEIEAPLQMKGQDVFKFAVRTSSSDISGLLEKNGLKADEIDHYLLHQANFRIISTIADFLDQPMDKFPVNIENHGNSSSASCPILLDQYKKSGKLKRGDKIMMSAFGAGLVSGVILFEW